MLLKDPPGSMICSKIPVSCLSDLTGIVALIGDTAQKAMLFELSASPKPGLIDRFNNGAHQDMDFFTFICSSVSLSRYFLSTAELGIKFTGTNLTDLLSEVRSIGKTAEKKMFLATRGINTHKGQIFSLGVLTAAAGYARMNNQDYAFHSETICGIAAMMCDNIIQDDLESLNCSNLNHKTLTYGEKLYLQSGITGIRGEAKSGFASVRKSALPFFKAKMSKTPHLINNHLIQALLYLMATVEDSNVVSRGGISNLQFMKNISFKALNEGGIYTDQGKKRILDMDRIFTERNISPGGCADLLAVMLFLYFLEQEGQSGG
ncbi:MAG: triphosphoribosyl-dephospho-CoA synthase CitG [Spirochaetes bacterium]|nr:triphosphoribosyl-dephospho-CoA synthase CitG [Spirochaetota bacterium]